MATKKTTIAAEIKVETGGAEKEVKDLKDGIQGVGTATEGSIAQLKELKKQLKNAAAGSEEFKALYNQIDDLEDKIKGSKKASSDWIDTLESAGGPIGALGAGLNKAKVATTSFSAALKATGIGLVIAAVAGLTAAFAKNEGAMKKLEPIMTQFGRILNGILAALEPVINAVIEFATDALPYVTQGFEVAYSAMSSFLQGLGLLGSAVKKFISGDFSGAWDDAKKSVSEFGTRYEAANKRFIEGTKELTSAEKEEQERRLAQQKEAAEKAEQIRKAAEEKRKQEELDKQKWDLERKEAQFKADQEEKEYGDQLIAEAEKADAERAAKAQKDREDALKVRTQLIINNYNNDKKLKEQEKINDDKLAQDKINNIKAIGNATEALGAIIGQQTTAGKALGVATALINTYTGASEVIRAKSVLPEPFGTIQKIASVAAIIATGIKSVKSIMGVQVPSTKGSSGGGGAMPSIPTMNVGAPLSPTMATTTLNQGQVNQIGNIAARAYVVESDISGNQERIVRLNRAARIS